MAVKKKVYTAKIKSSSRSVLIAMFVIFLILFGLQFEAVANLVAPVIDKTVKEVQNFGRTWALVILGGVLVYAGIVFVGIPVLGGLALISGIALVTLAVYNWFSDKSPKMTTARRMYPS
jgi:hypothetical protein